MQCGSGFLGLKNSVGILFLKAEITNKKYIICG